MKNTFVPVNSTPPEVLSLIPDYCEDSERDGTSIKLTHVCRRWREIFISRPSLWTRLGCKNAEKTKAYIERSRTSPLEILLNGRGAAYPRREAFYLVVPHIGRARTLSILNWWYPASAEFLPILVGAFACPVPLLEKLKIDLIHGPTPTLSSTLFEGDLSSLRELDLTGILMPLSCRGLENLTIFSLSDAPRRETLLTYLLDFFESAPRLRDVRLKDSIPEVSSAPPERIVSLPDLKKLVTIADTPNSILLNHLSIPPGASVVLEFTFSGENSPIPSHISSALDNFHNISHIATMNLCFGPERRAIQLNGPSGELYIRGKWVRDGARQHVGTTRLLRFLNRFDSSRCRRLGITQYASRPDSFAPIAKFSAYQLLHPMGDLRTLTLIESNNLPFILTCNPDQNPDKIVLCPKLEEITLYVKPPYKFHVEELLSMAKERASRDAKLSAITIVSTDALAPSMDIFELRKHVSRLECKFDNVPPAWDTLPGHNSFDGNL